MSPGEVVHWLGPFSPLGPVPSGLLFGLVLLVLYTTVLAGLEWLRTWKGRQ